MKIANPQGKGLVPVLEHWNELAPTVVRRSSPRELLLDYLVGILVLSARFSFAPVVGREYYLYWRRDEWVLSLVSPGEWRGREPGIAVGAVRLREDRTWAISPDAGVAQHPQLISALEAFQEQFVSSIDSDQPLRDGLPWHVASLPWYPRLLALALSRSLADSLAALGESEGSGRALLATGQVPRLVV